MKSVKKYIIEFFVIVLGVSVSFLAEQWRQDINTRQERDELVEKARKEIKSFIQNDSINQTFASPEAVFKKIISKKSSVNIDTFILAFLNTVHAGEITHRLPNTLQVAQRRDLNPELGGHFQNINEALESIKEMDDDTKKILNIEISDLLEKYEIANDFIKIQERVNENLRKANYEWEVLGMLKEIDKEGNYRGFFEDMQVQKELKWIYSNLLGNAYSVLIIKDNYFEIEKILSKEKH
jgi:hypothetical protein